MSLKRTKLVQLGIDFTHIWPTIYHVSDVQFINDNTTGNECGTLVSIWLIPNLGVMNMKTLLPSNKYTETLSPFINRVSAVTRHANVSAFPGHSVWFF